MVQRHKVDEFRRVFVVGVADIVQHNIRHILHFRFVIPKGIEQLHVLRGEWCFHAVDHVVGVVAALTANINCGENVDRHIGRLLRFRGNGHKTAHILASCVGFERCLAADPLSAFFCDSALRHFITQFNLKLSTVQAALATDAGDVKFALLLFGPLFDKGWRSKDEAKLIYLLKLFFQFLKGIHGETSRGNGYTASPLNGLTQIILDERTNIVQYFHWRILPRTVSTVFCSSFTLMLKFTYNIYTIIERSDAHNDQQLPQLITTHSHLLAFPPVPRFAIQFAATIRQLQYTVAQVTEG